MRPAANDGATRAWCMLPAAALAALLTLSVISAGTTPDNVTARESDSDHLTAEASPAAEKTVEAKRRAVIRNVAWTSLGIILILIIFVVVVMILSRRMRIHYLGWDRRITFSRLWDVWWQKTDRKPEDRDNEPGTGSPPRSQE